MEPTHVVVLVLIAGVLGPSVLALWITRAMSTARREDWARQDQVAARVEEVREAAIVSDERRARTAKEEAAAMRTRLEQIHASLAVIEETQVRLDRLTRERAPNAGADGDD